MIKLSCIHLAHNKNTENCKIQNLPLPESVKIPMLMNMGAPCNPLVKVGDTVSAGQKIGDTDAFFSVPVHSGVSGTVTAISDFKMANGNVCKAVEIKCDNEQKLSDDIHIPEITDKASFLKAVRESGIVGLGGAGFPTHIKLAPKTKVDCLVVNGAECEPYITADYRVMLEYADDLIEGLSKTSDMLEIPKIIIGIENNKPEAIRLLTEKTSSLNKFEIKSLPSAYPQGGEKVLIYNCTGRIVKEGKLPADEGVIVMNVSTAVFLNVYLKTGMPFVNRILTVDGDTVKKSGNYCVPIGTSVSYILDQCECDKDKINKLIMGGPMMGMTAYDIDQPVSKANNAILAMNKIESNKESACIRCGRCMRACPFNLMPTEIEKAYIRRDINSLKKLKVTLCMNCGCCTYVCPAKRKLAETNQLAKGIIPRDK